MYGSAHSQYQAQSVKTVTFGGIAKHSNSDTGGEYVETRVQQDNGAVASVGFCGKVGGIKRPVGLLMPTKPSCRRRTRVAARSVAAAG